MSECAVYCFYYVFWYTQSSCVRKVALRWAAAVEQWQCKCLNEGLKMQKIAEQNDVWQKTQLVMLADGMDGYFSRDCECSCGSESKQYIHLKHLDAGYHSFILILFHLILKFCKIYFYSAANFLRQTNLRVSHFYRCITTQRVSRHSPYIEDRRKYNPPKELI